MLKLIRALLFLAGVVVLVALSIANRQPVDVSFWPLPYAITVPLYWVFLAVLIGGAVLGGLAAWLSGTAARAEARRLRGRTAVLDRQEAERREAEERAQVEEARRKTQALALTPPPATAARTDLALAPARA